MDFPAAFALLMQFEGGYSDVAADPGGKTKWGITESEARANGYTGDMRDLTQDQAMPIYRAKYWQVCRCDELPDAIRYDVFDAAVNSGPPQAIRWLQVAVGAQPDGIIGPATMAAVMASNAVKLSATLNGIRLKFMTGLTTWPVFGKGWARRISTLLTKS